MKDVAEPIAEPIEVIQEGQLNRRKLPDRRISETRKVTFEKEVGSINFYITIGYDPAEPSKPLEVFYDDGFKSGADLEWVAQDAAVLISLALQAGYSPDQIGTSLATRLHYDSTELPASLLGTIVEELKKPPQWSEQDEIVREVCAAAKQQS